MADASIDFTSIEFSWPEKGDKLFIGGDDWWNNACLNQTPSDWVLYIIGYKRAADVLVEHIDQNRRNQDFLVYPTVFLYRQYLELRMKRLIVDGRELLDAEVRTFATHNLVPLWAECKAIVIKVWPDILTSDLEAVEDIIDQFSRIDKTSMAFRYPVDKENKKLIPDEVRYINLRNLAEVMGKVATFFDGTASGISDFLDHKREMEAEFNGYMAAEYNDYYGW